jgi:catechol 2,3-dioxygenase-like lactoylglutathione lyase family enzyme
VKSIYKTLSHVGVHSGPDLEAALKFYIDGLGLKEGFRLKNAEGRESIIYIHVTPTTFIELFTPRSDKKDFPKAHLSIEVLDIDKAAEDVKKRIPAECIRNPNIVNGADGARMFMMTDPAGNWLEFQEFPEGSKQKASIEKMKEAKRE